MSGKIDDYLLNERIRKKRKEKQAKLNKQQEVEVKQKKKKEHNPQPYEWRKELLKRKDAPKQSPPSSPEESSTTKFANTRSPIQKLLRKSPSSKLQASPSTSIDSKWISSSNRKISSNHATVKHSNMARITQESPRKQVTTKDAPMDDSDDSDSDDSLIAHMMGREKKSKQDIKNNSQESMKSASDEESKGDSPAKKSTRKRSRSSMDSESSSSEDEGGRRSQECCKSSRHESNRQSCRGDSDSLSEEDADSHSQRPNRHKPRRLWSDQKSEGRRGMSFSSEDELEEYSEDSSRKSSGHKSSKKKSARKHSQDSDSDFWSEDEKSKVSGSRQGENRDTNQNRKCRNSKNKSLEDSSSSDEEEKPASRKLFTNSSDDDEAKKATKPVLNPFTVAQQEQQSFESIAACCTRPAKKADDDLWSDMDDDDESKTTDKSKAKKSKKRSRSKSTKSTRDSKKSSVQLSSPSKKGGASYWYLPDTEDRYEIMSLLKREDEEALQRKIHPKFDDPEWLYDYEPLELGEGTRSAVSVPASLSRYLAHYQKEGIRFMHDCLAKRSGTIMGDEMGLGKTVQVIGLLCALFEKTGTGLDLLRIHRRHKLIMQQQEMGIREEEKAMLAGRLYVPKKIDTKSLDLPLWYPVLIIVPPTVVENWQYEFERFSNFAVAVFSGTREVRDRALDKIRYGRAEVLIAAKSLFQDKNSARDLREISWKLVIIDEFHTFKNVNGNLATNLRDLKADHRPLVLGMTGTLMQNDHRELWNLIDLVQTDYLGSWKDFKDSTARAIKLGRQKGANEATIAASNRKSIALEEHLAKLFIARKKDVVLADKLTKKTVNVVFCKPSEIQKRVYAHILTLPDVQQVKMATSPCDCGVNRSIFKKFYKLKSQAARVKYIRENQNDIQKRSECCYTVPKNPRRDEEDQPLIDPDAVIWRMLDGHDEASDEGCPRCPYCVLFSVLDKLNKLSSHVGSLQAHRPKSTPRRGSEEHVRFKKELEFAKVAFPPDVIGKLPGGLFRQDASYNEHFELSGKMKELHKLLKQYKNEGCKVLVFSYSTKTLDFIEQYVRSQNHSFLRIDGQVKPKLRQDLCNRFNKNRDVFLFLLSTKACGLGLNLTAANKVIIFDVEWNPSWDEQAQDRAYRIGQQQDVEVVRLVTEGTIDELRYLRQLYKVQLKNETLNSSEAKARSARVFRGIQGDKSRKGELFGTENLLKLKEDGSFLSDVWKSKRHNGKSNTSNEFGVHNTEDIASNLNSDLCDKLFVSDDAEDTAVAYMESQRDSGAYDSEDEDPSPRHLHKHSQDGEKKMAALPRDGQEQVRHQDSRNKSSERDGDNTVNHDEPIDPVRGVAANLAEGDEEDSETDGSNEGAPPVNANRESEQQDSRLIANAVNQDALYDEEQGGALYEEGDDGYDEEMGGETQNAYASYANMQLPENPQDGTFSDDDDDDDESGDHNPGLNLVGFFNEIVEEDVTAAGRSARRGGAAVPQQQEAGMAAGVAQIREAMRQMQDGVPRRQASMPADSRALNVIPQRREVQREGQPIRRTSESKISVQLRPEPVVSLKEDFFRSRDARGTVDDSDRDDAEAGGRVAQKPTTHRDDSDGSNNTSGGRVAKKPKTDSDDSDESAKKPPKKKVPINLFGKTTTASKSKSKGDSGGLCLPTYKKPRKKKKKK